jgi:hypothetical protein
MPRAHHQFFRVVLDQNKENWLDETSYCLRFMSCKLQDILRPTIVLKWKEDARKSDASTATMLIYAPTMNASKSSAYGNNSMVTPQEDTTSAYRRHAARDHELGSRGAGDADRRNLKASKSNEDEIRNGEANSRLGTTPTNLPYRRTTSPSQRATLVYSRSQIERRILNPS